MTAVPVFFSVSTVTWAPTTGTPVSSSTVPLTVATLATAIGLSVSLSVTTYGFFAAPLPPPKRPPMPMPKFSIGS